MISTLRHFRSSFHLPEWTVPLALLLLCLLSYGSMPAKLGFYWDDWFIGWYIHFLGPSTFIEAFGNDRPLLGGLYVVVTSLVGESPLAWQFLAIFARWLGCLALWWTLRGLWPRRTTQAAMIAFLFAVYPGFSQQYIAISYSFHLLVLAMCIFSLGAMNWAVRSSKRFWLNYGLSLVFAGLGIFTMEYYFGLELLRPLFLWMILSETGTDVRKQLKRLVMYWFPYMALLAAFLAWRISTPTPRGQVVILRWLAADPLGTALDLGINVLKDVFKVSALAWAKVLTLSKLLAFEPPTILKYVLIVMGAAALVFFCLAFLNDPQEEGPEEIAMGRRWARNAILLGVIALIFGGVPFWMTGLQISLSFTRDRFTLPMMLGVALLLAGLVMLIPRLRLIRFGLVAMAVGLAAGLHFQTALMYRQEWLLQKDFFWQLAWRAPDLKPGTAVLISDVPFVYDWDNSLTAPLNWTYAPNFSGRQLPYQLYNVESHLSRGLPELDQDYSIYQSNRLTPFEGSTSQAIVVFYRPSACLKVVDPLRDKSLPDKPRYFRELLSFSRPELILPDFETPAQPPAQFFAPEPEHAWCYFFQKAELAVQSGDWERAAALGDQALETEHKIYRRNAVELIPYIEGYTHVGRWEDAVDLSMRAYQAWANMRLMLCDTWTLIRDSAQIDSNGRQAFEKIRDQLQCGFSGSSAAIP
jgi:hypothetical protein